MNIAIIQARMNSRRLEGKVMMPLCGRPVLCHVVDRCVHARKVDRVIVATGMMRYNNPIVEWCIKNGVEYYVGEQDNVLKRYHDLGTIVCQTDDDNIVRITADCPLTDPSIIDEMLDSIGSAGYYGNQKVYIDGYDVEILKWKTLKYIYSLYQYDEHVTKKYKDSIKTGLAYHDKVYKDLHDIHLSLDTAEDYNYLSYIFGKLYHKNKYFGYSDVAGFLAL